METELVSEVKVVLPVFLFFQFLFFLLVLFFLFPLGFLLTGSLKSGTIWGSFPSEVVVVVVVDLERVIPPFEPGSFLFFFGFGVLSSSSSSESPARFGLGKLSGLVFPGFCPLVLVLVVEELDDEEVCEVEDEVTIGFEVVMVVVIIGLEVVMVVVIIGLEVVMVVVIMGLEVVIMVPA